jgi:uncharacterized protein YndB with AHSA1/START domain
MPKTNLGMEILISALPSKVWKVLTSPDYLRQYFFEDVQCSWAEGSSISRITEEGEELIPNGKVLQSVPGVTLKYSLPQQNGSLVTTYELMVAGDGVALKLHCDGFTGSDEDYLVWVQEASLLLKKIKWLAEYS